MTNRILILLYGTCRVGKSSLIMRFFYDMFPSPSLKEGLYDHVYPTIKVNDGTEIQIEAELIDSNNRQDYFSHYPFYKIYNGFMLCFSLDNLESFQDLPDAYEYILSLRPRTNQKLFLWEQNQMLMIQKELLRKKKQKNWLLV